MNTAAYAPQHFRLRISTALLLVSLVGFPFAAQWVPVPQIPAEPALLHKTLHWLLFAFPVMMLMVAFVVAFITAVILTFRRMWFGIVQCVIEMGVCIGFAILFPAIY